MYKNKCRINLSLISLNKTNVKIPQQSKTALKKAKPGDHPIKPTNNLIILNNTENQKIDFEKAYIRRFPGEPYYIIYTKEKIFVIFNLETGDKIRTQRTGDRSGFISIIPFPKQRVFATGIYFLIFIIMILEEKWLILLILIIIILIMILVFMLNKLRVIIL